jgi:hypothetical protein
MAAKKKDNPLNRALTIRVTREQRTKMHALAIREGYASISEAIRALADGLGAEATKKEVTP